MVLESIKVESGFVLRVIVFNGRYASLSEIAFIVTIIYLIYGGEDSVIDLAYAVAA